MKKLIYLEDAIDALNMADDKGQIHSILDVNDVIKSLPSAQPERKIELDGTASNIEILSELRSQFCCFDEVEEPCYRALSDAIQALSAQPERRWIPVSERLPEANGRYLVTLWDLFEVDEYARVIIMLHENGHWVYPRHIPDWIKVLAWMPLPELYREEE